MSRMHSNAMLRHICTIRTLAFFERSSRVFLSAVVIGPVIILIRRHTVTLQSLEPVLDKTFVFKMDSDREGLIVLYPAIVFHRSEELVLSYTNADLDD